MNKFLICLTLCHAFSAVSNAARVDDQSYANFLQIYSGTFDGGEITFLNGTRYAPLGALTKNPIINTKIGDASAQKFFTRKSYYDIIQFYVEATKVVNGTIVLKTYTIMINRTTGVLPENWTADIATYAGCDSVISRLGNANDQFTSFVDWCGNQQVPRATIIVNCTGQFWSLEDGSFYKTLKQEHVTGWPSSFNNVLKPQKPCGY
ncbi:uncharacterized protein LOC131927604 isoform X2 [Physella acuta]|uniref:uncharacterized protein LOC131927604 isoform X2 n=1 Tax=Physella acuta TaxID=109671 RepID=UPI0027DAEED8|nr:uncharacterized protein LOC131927604 isoform X2 [Physella acuta]